MTTLPAGVAVLSFYCIIVILMPRVLMHYLFGPERFYSDKQLTEIACTNAQRSLILSELTSVHIS